ncbi:MAG: SRPBCC family protein [Limisphaerales bacterium]
MKTTEEPIVIEQAFDLPATEVWSAITVHERMIKWFFEDIPDFRAEVGFTTLFTVTCEDRAFPHRWKITEVIENQLIRYDWRYDGYEGVADVVFELIAGDGTTLRLTHTMVTDSDNAIPEFQRPAGVEGWTYFIQNTLKAHLAPAS